jgi:hypothetical protein
LLAQRIHTEVEALEAAGAEQDEVPGFTEHHFVAGAFPRHMNLHDTSPALDDRPIRLPEPPLTTPLDAKGIQHLGRDPGQFGARIHQHRWDGAPLAGAGRVLDFHVDAKRSHFLRH